MDSNSTLRKLAVADRKAQKLRFWIPIGTLLVTMMTILGILLARHVSAQYKAHKENVRIMEMYLGR